MKKFLLLFITPFCALFAFAQDINIEGYTFESDDRGYLNLVKLEFFENGSTTPFETTYSDTDGFFKSSLPAGKSFQLKATKDLFFENIQTVSTTGGDPTLYLKVKMEREPGYILDVTMAQKKDSLDEEVDAILNARIDIYNNTQGREELVYEDYPHVNFQYTLKKGNHYTILMRKEGYLAKRIEAYVNVNECIVCIDGVGSLNPGVSDNLTQGFQMGTLLANVELDKINFDKVYTLNNIYYDLGKASLKKEAQVELDNLITILKDNPSISIELGSHTDSRGKDRFNMKLSQKRAESAANYLFKNGDVDPRRVMAKGYGETQLTNDCDNDTDCAEKDHEKNRRTEFKILSKAKSEGFLPLKEIKRLENMDAMIADLANQEIVEIKEGDELPEDLKKQLEKEAAERAKKEKKNEQAAVEEQVDQEKEAMTNTEEKMVVEEVEETRKDPGKLGVFGEKRVMNDLELGPRIKNVEAEEYSGFLVKIYISKNELSLDSPEIKGLKDVWFQKVGDELYYYYLGSFENKQDANSVYDQLAGNCPVCSVVKFEDGAIRP